MQQVGGSLVARDVEVARLAAFLDDEGPGALVVRGEAGVGKTVLVGDLVRRATDAGRRVIRVVGVEAESTLPLAGLHQVVYPFASLAATLAGTDRHAVDVVLGRAAEPAPSTMVLGTALLDLLGHAAAARELLIVVDDGHWLDVPSAQVLAFAGRRLVGWRLRLVVVTRTDTASSFDDAGLGHLDVAPFTASQAERFLDTTHPGMTPVARRLVLDHAAGNPLALVELPVCVVTVDGRPTAEDLLRPRDVPLSDRLERVYGRRVSYLDRASRTELLRGALDGIVAGADAGTGGRGTYRMHAVDGAIEHGLLVVDAAGELTFRHPLVRSAVIQLATVNERREAHAFLATVHRDDLERRAVHLAAATVDPDEDVARSLDAAARRATRRGGAGTAVAWLTRAAELSEDPAHRARRLADAAYLAGQAALLDEAQDLLDTTAATDSAGSPTSVLTAAYLGLYRDGDVTTTHRRVIAALRAPAVGPGADAGTRLVNLLLAISQFAGDPARWALTERVIDDLGDRVDPLALIYRDSWGDVVRRGHTVRARLDEQFLLLSGGEPWDVMRLAVSAFYVDTLGDYRPYLERMVRREQDNGAVTNVMTLLQLVVLDQIASGRWADAEATGRRGLDLTGAHGYELFAHQFRAFLGVLAARRGDLDLARRHEATVRAWGRPRGIGFLTGFADAIHLGVALAEADYETAYAVAGRITPPGSFAPYVHQAPRTLLDLVEAAVHTGHLDEARRHAVAARDLGLPDISPRLALTTAGALAMTADDEAAGPHFDAAVAHPAGAAFPFELARIELAHGVWLRRARHYTAARAALARAADRFQGLGATPWAARARTELRASGTAVRLGTTGTAALSAQERVIAELAATGLTNKEIGTRLFLSPRTVGAHLYRVFPKLGVTSRSALRDALGGVARPDPSDPA